MPMLRMKIVENQNGRRILVLVTTITGKEMDSQRMKHRLIIHIGMADGDRISFLGVSEGKLLF